MLQAVILAGGLGTRLRPFTENVPKAMVSIRGVPFIERQISFLKRQNIQDILLLTGHFSEQIESHLGCGRRLGVKLAYSREPKPLGTGGALMLAYDRLQPNFLLMYGDSYLPVPVDALWAKLQSPSVLAVVTAYRDERHLTQVLPNLQVDKDSGRVLQYAKNGGEALQHIEAGCSVLRKAALSGLPFETMFSLEATLFPQLVAQGSLFSITSKRRFYDIGTPQGLTRITASVRHWV